MDKWILFDVDDVLCNFRESLYTSFKPHKDVHWSTWDNYDCVKLFGLKNEAELHVHMRDKKVLENSDLEPGALDMFNQLKYSGYHIGLLTARAWHKEGKDITEQFVHAHNLPVDRVVISGFHTDTKSSHIPKFTGEIKAYVDDSVHHVQDFISQGVSQSYLMDRPWNKSSNLPRVNSLRDFENIILKRTLKPKF